MKKCFFVCGFTALFSFAFSQQYVIDSLLIVLKSPLTDTAKINTLNALAKQLNSASDEKAADYARQAMTLSQKINYEKGIASADFNTGYYFDNISLYDSAKFYYQKSLSLMEKLGMTRESIRTVASIGNVFLSIGKYKDGLDYFLRSLRMAEDAGDKKQIASAYVGLGNVYIYMADNKKGIDYYFKALKIQDEIGDKRGASASIANIAIVYTNQGDYDKAIEYHLQSMEIDKTLGYQLGVAQTLTNIGVAYYEKKDFKKSLEYFLKSLEVYEKAGEQRGIANTTNNIGSIYMEMHQHDKALEFYRKGLERAKKIGAKDLEKNSYRDIAGVYDSLKNFKNAYEYHKLFSDTKDSLLNEESHKQIAEMQTKYETEKKEQQITLLNKDKQLQDAQVNRQKIIIWSVGAGFLVVLLLSIFIFRERKKSEKLLLNILPVETAKELKQNGKAIPRHYESVTVMFTDFKGFTNIAEKLSAEELVSELDFLFKKFDEIISKYNIEKIKTIGDAYMCASGLPTPNNNHAENIVRAGIEIQNWMKGQNNKWSLRMGVHSGPVTAGVVGDKKFAYDIWGDTVNTASRMESSGEAGKINISGTTHQLLCHSECSEESYAFTHRGKIPAKNKGEIDMYFVENHS